MARRLRKAKNSQRRMEKKPDDGPKEVEKYLARAPETARRMLKEMRELIRATLPSEATETTSYRIPAFRHDGIVVWYAGFAKHCSLFPTAAVIERFKDELKDYSTSKGTIHFPTDKPLPKTLIKKLVKGRIADIAQKRNVK